MISYIGAIISFVDSYKVLATISSLIDIILVYSSRY